MKKFLNVLILLVVMGCMVACGNNIDDEQENLNDNTNSGEVVEVKKYFPKENLGQYADLQTISIPENPTTGYEWVYVLGDTGVVNVQKDEFVANSENEGLVGVGGNRIIEIVGLTEGETTIKCEYMRSFEEAAIETVTYKLSVNAENQIAVVEEVCE